METIRHFLRRIFGNIRQIVQIGDIHHANEITANLAVVAQISLMMLCFVLCCILNALGLFSISRDKMQYCLLVTALMNGPILVNCRKNNYEPSWVKYALATAVLITCGNLSAILTHNVTLLMVMPVVLSVRYFDFKFSLRISIYTAIVSLIATLFSVYYGIVNLNVVHPDEGTVLVVEGSLRDTLVTADFDRIAYMKDLLINDFLPRFLALAAVCVTCCHIASRGRQMINLQIYASQKSSRIETELNLATQIQKSMLPCIFPPFPEFDQLDLYAINIPALEVGGDFYDHFKLDENHIALVIADVSGKGVGAALFMMISKTILKNQLLAGKEPWEAMTIANHQLSENNEAGLFVTAWAGIYEISTRKLKYTNAGHNPPLVRQMGEGYRYLKDRHGMVLAGFDGTCYKQSEIQLGVGDRLFLYTDGITEATDARNALFGEERLLDTLGRLSVCNAKEQVDGVLEEVRQFVGNAPQFDDMTLMSFRVLK